MNISLRWIWEAILRFINNRETEHFEEYFEWDNKLWVMDDKQKYDKKNNI
jgi:hypothetical protein